MSRGLQPGIYKLRLAADPSPLVGVPATGPGPQFVVTRGQENLWRVDLVNGQYQLYIVIEGLPFPLNIFSQAGNVVGNIDPTTPDATWNITGPEGGPYQILVDDPSLPPTGWTVETPGIDGSPIVLDILQPSPPPENQKWYFVSRDAAR